jgi:hypothetical protein
MRIIEFDGNGRPDLPGIASGAILLLVQGEDISVVRLEIVPPEDFGPTLEHASNAPVLAADARRAVQAAFPEGLSRERHWVIECPPALAARARFPAKKSTVES